MGATPVSPVPRTRGPVLIHPEGEPSLVPLTSPLLPAPVPLLSLLAPVFRRAHAAVEGLAFSATTGTVVSHEVFSRTHVAGGGDSARVRVETLREVWVRTEEGEEACFTLDADAVQLREGHRVTVVDAGREDWDDTYVLAVLNHSDRRLDATLDVMPLVDRLGAPPGCLLLFLAPAAGFAAAAVWDGWEAGVLAAGALAGLWTVRYLAYLVPAGVRRQSVVRRREAVVAALEAGGR